MDRPKLSDGYIAKAAAEDLLPELMEWAEAGESERANYLADATEVMKHAWLQNGYQLARDLERKGYDPDARLVEILDGATSLLSNRHHRAVKDWVKGWNVTVPWSIGQMAKVKARGKEYIGEVTAIREDEATCIVTVAELGHERGWGFVINSEDIVSADAVAVSSL